MTFEFLYRCCPCLRPRSAEEIKSENERKERKKQKKKEKQKRKRQEKLERKRNKLIGQPDPTILKSDKDKSKKVKIPKSDFPSSAQEINASENAIGNSSNENGETETLTDKSKKVEIPKSDFPSGAQEINSSENALGNSSNENSETQAVTDPSKKSPNCINSETDIEPCPNRDPETEPQAAVQESSCSLNSDFEVDQESLDSSSPTQESEPFQESSNSSDTNRIREIEVVSEALDYPVPESEHNGEVQIQLDEREVPPPEPDHNGEIHVQAEEVLEPEPHVENQVQVEESGLPEPESEPTDGQYPRQNNGFVEIVVALQDVLSSEFITRVTGIPPARSVSTRLQLQRPPRWVYVPAPEYPEMELFGNYFFKNWRNQRCPWKLDKFFNFIRRELTE